MASQCPHQLHLLSHFGGLDPICPLNSTLSSLTVYPNSPKQKPKLFLTIKLSETVKEYMNQKGREGPACGLTLPLFEIDLPAKKNDSQEFS